MNLQDLFNLAARKGQASTIFVPQKQQPSYFETASRAPQKASSIFVPAVSTQMPSYLETAGQYAVVSPLFKFPTKEKEPTKPKKEPVSLPAGTVQPAAIVSGLTPTGEVDRSQSDEYKSQMAQYRNLISQKKEQEAEDLGMQMWMQKYGGKLGLTGPNPLMQETANAPSGFGTFVPAQGATPAVLQASEAPMKAFGQEVKTYFPGAGPEGFSPLDAQDQQQEATAAQADMATTVKLPVRDRVARLRSQVLGGY